jgi:hypothetical protein
MQLRGPGQRCPMSRGPRQTAPATGNWGLTPRGGTVVALSSKSAAPAVPASASHAAKPKAHVKAVPSPSCTRTVWPPLQPQADEIGNTDYTDHAACADSLSTFASEAGQADGECTTIALASDNPGYNVNATPAPPLKDVIESAGPGC